MTLGRIIKMTLYLSNYRFHLLVLGIVGAIILNPPGTEPRIITVPAPVPVDVLGAIPTVFQCCICCMVAVLAAVVLLAVVAVEGAAADDGLGHEQEPHQHEAVHEVVLQHVPPRVEGLLSRALGQHIAHQQGAEHSRHAAWSLAHTVVMIPRFCSIVQLPDNTARTATSCHMPARSTWLI